VIYLADCVELMRLMPAGSVDAVFADTSPTGSRTAALRLKTGVWNP
jgi:DNA modification methylase